MQSHLPEFHFHLRTYLNGICRPTNKPLLVTQQQTEDTLDNRRSQTFANPLNPFTDNPIRKGGKPFANFLYLHHHIPLLSDLGSIAYRRLLVSESNILGRLVRILGVVVRVSRFLSSLLWRCSSNRSPLLFGGTSILFGCAYTTSVAVLALANPLGGVVRLVLLITTPCITWDFGSGCDFRSEKTFRAGAPPLRNA